jgi:hypothetical protein
MLDECLTVGPSQVLISYFALEHPPVEAAFVVDYFGQEGEKDRHWSDVLASQGGWFVISGDRDKGRKPAHKRLVDGPPLHKILPGKGITAVYISGAIQQAPGTEKVRAITSLWPEIKAFFESAPPGSRKQITKHGGGFILRDW